MLIPKRNRIHSIRQYNFHKNHTPHSTLTLNDSCVCGSKWVFVYITFKLTVICMILQVVYSAIMLELILNDMIESMVFLYV